MEVRAEEGGKSESPLVIRGIGLEPYRATGLHAKAGRLPHGLSLRENLRNRLMRKSR
jgi:hypothetical protein